MNRALPADPQTKLTRAGHWPQSTLPQGSPFAERSMYFVLSLSSFMLFRVVWFWGSSLNAT